MGKSRVGAAGIAAAAIVILTGVFVVINTYKVSAVMPVLMEELSLGTGAAGMLMSIIDYMGVILAIPGGLIVVKINPRNTVLVALACGIVGCAIGALTDNYYVLLAGRFIEGACYALVAVSAPALIAAWIPPEKRGLPMAIWSCWMGLGMLITFQTAYLFSTWHALWWACAALMVIAGFLVVFFCKMPEQSHDEEDGAGGGEPAKMSEGFKSVPTWALGLACICFTCGCSALNAFCVTYGSAVLGLEEMAASGLSSWLTVGMIVGAVVMGFVLNRFSTVKARTTVFVVAMVCTCAAYAAMFSYSIETAAPVLFLCGFALQMAPATSFTVIADTAPRPALIGIATAILALMQAVGGVLVSPVGFIIDAYGWGVLTPIFVVVGILGIVFAFLFKASMRKGAAAADRPAA